MHSYLSRLSEHIMAVVQIPMGGKMMGIDVPDFAMESTQQSIASYAQQQVSILNSLAAAQGITVKTLQVQSTQQQNSQKANVQQQSTILNGMAGLTKRAINTATSVLPGIEQDSKISAGVEKIFAGMRLPALGAGVGTVIGIFEEFANQMSTFSRIGAGIGTNFITLRDEAANVGLGLDQLAKLSAESGAAISSLGANTTQGTQRFVGFVGALREATKEFGYFGMSSSEMAQFTADELDLRRQMYDTEYNRNLNEQDLAVQMKENLNLQSAMARITGQDVRARIKAQQDFQRDSINAGIMASLSVDQQEAIKAASGALSQLGSGGTMITEGLRNMVAGMPAELAPGFAEFSAVLSSQGVDVKGAMEEINGMIASGADPAVISSAVDALAGQVKNVDPSAMVTLAIGGVEGAAAALQTRVETIASGAETMAESIEKINTALGEMNTAVADGSVKILGQQANIEQMMAGVKNDVTTGILKSLGIDPSNVTSVQAGFASMSEMLAELPNSEGFQTLLESAIGNVMRSTGTTAVLGYGMDAANIGGPRKGEAFEPEMMASLLAEAAGLSQLADMLRMPMTVFNATETAGAIAKAGNLGTALSNATTSLQEFVVRVGETTNDLGNALLAIVNPE